MSKYGLNLGSYGQLWVIISVAALKIVNIRAEGVASSRINVKLISMKWVKSAYVEHLCVSQSVSLTVVLIDLQLELYERCE
jgi:uncharacterized membrane protein